jgi:DNA-binding beta-propeller fold protein YncE
VAASIQQVPFDLVALPESAQSKFSDTLDIDGRHRILYLGDNWSGGVDLFNIASATPEYMRTIKLRGRIYGVVVAGDVEKLFVGMSGSTLAAISINGPKDLVELIHTGGVGHVDLLDYDPAHGRVFAANRLDGFLSCIDATTNQIVGRVDGLGRGLEQPRYSPVDKMVYLTDNVENVLYQIDPEKNALVERFAIAEPCFPNGMAIDPSTNLAVLASSNEKQPRTVVWDLTKQEMVDVIEDCGGADGVVYVPRLDRYLVAAPDSAGGPVVGVFGMNPVRLLAKVPTAKGASWAAFDSHHGTVIVPAVSNGRPALLNIAFADS